MKEQTTQNRIIYFDFLRIFAIIAVIFVHVAAENWYSTEPRSLTWNLYSLVDSLVRWGVPIFVMISGALFLNRNQSLKKIFRKHIIKLIILFFVWSLIYAIWESSVGNAVTISDFLINFFKGPAHLWFLPMIIGLYLITPLLQKIISDKKSTRYFLTLSLIFAFIIPEVINIIDIVFPTTANVLKYINGCLNLNFVLGFSGYFILGFCLHNTKISKKQETIIYLLGALGIVVTIILSALASYYKNAPTAVFYENMSINVLLPSIAIFVFTKKHLNNQLSPKKQKLLLTLSKCTLGVYLVHLLILFMLDYFLNFNTASFNPLLAIPTLGLSVIVISLIITLILNQIPFIKKWLI
ncbi:MAG: acyltransferase family protein [Candidatus Saccharibacteria bacterium]|nr:acyltransferase family protein [Candidatus Saccharibacteria bacterium]